MEDLNMGLIKAMPVMLPPLGTQCLVASREKALADAITAAGYTVLNQVICKKPLDTTGFETVRAAFAISFPALSLVSVGIAQA